MAKEQLTKRFEREDINRWQQKADKKTKGNLNLWMENILNIAAPKEKCRKNKIGSNHT